MSKTILESEASGDAMTLRELISFVSEAMKQDLDLDTTTIGANVGMSFSIPAPLRLIAIREEN